MKKHVILRGLLLAVVVGLCTSPSAAQGIPPGAPAEAVQAERALRYNDAERIYAAALATADGRAMESTQAADAYFFLGDFYRRRGNPAKAEPLLLRALALREKLLGPQDAAVAAVLVNLAVLRSSQGKYGEAEAPARRANAIYEKLGARTLETAQALGTLGWIARLQDDLPSAQEMLERAVEIAEKLRGPADAIGATEMNNLALVYKAEGRTLRAEQLLREVLELRLRVQGPGHPDVAITLNNIAGLLSQRWQVDEAEKLLKRALKIFEKSYGPEHIQVGNTLNSLAMNSVAKNDLAHAEAFARRALAIFEKAYGPHHTQVAAMLENYAGVLERRGHPAEAGKARERARQIRGTFALESRK